MRKFVKKRVSELRKQPSMLFHGPTNLSYFEMDKVRSLTWIANIRQRYFFKEEIAKGSRGTILRARHMATKVDCVIKIVSKSLMHNNKALQVQM